jgi:Putative Actinobacterial Holin-X, holin superfamily III
MSPGDGLPPKDTAEKTLGEIVSEVSDKASLLVREEIELAKAEVTSKIQSLGTGAAIGGAAAVFLIFAITMFFHGLAWLLDDLFGWEGSVWPGFAIVFALLVVAAAIAALIARRLFQRGAPPTPDLAIEEAKRTRVELEAQTIQRDQVGRTLEKGEEVGA